MSNEDQYRSTSYGIPRPGFPVGGMPPSWQPRQWSEDELRRVFREELERYFAARPSSDNP